mmetsp:Transcript_130357/g.237015  ORF Transcript_130357/g.237015 Transcript_130357/m.237015 type:complete len:1015 (+) Transcript_130357:136-3180(+)
MALDTMTAFEAVSRILNSLQTEIIIFFLAIAFHTMFFGKYNVKLGKAKRKGQIPTNESGKRSSPAPSRPQSKPYAEAAERICKAAGSVESVTGQLKSELQNVPREDLLKALTQLLESAGRNANSEFLAAVRAAAREADQKFSLALGELLLKNYLGLRLQNEFNSVLSEVELAHGVVDSTRPTLALLALKGALRWGDLEAAIWRLEKVCSLWREDKTPSAAPQAVMQQLVKLAAQSEALPKLVQKLSDLNLFAEALNTLLSECSQRGDITILKEVEQIGRKQGIQFTDITYSSLLRAAQNSEEARQVFEQAASEGVLGKELLQSASEWAHAHSDASLAGAVLKRLPAAPTAEVAANLLRFYGPGGPGAKADAAHNEVLKLYMQHFQGIELSVGPERMVAQAALHTGRKEVLARLLSEMNDNARRVSLMKSFGAEKRLEDALAIFWAFPEKNTCLYNAAMDICVECDCNSAAQKVMAAAMRAGLADAVTYNTIIKAHVQSNDLRQARQAIKDMQNANLQPNSVTFNEILDATIKVRPEDVWKIIDEMRVAGVKPNHITCSILLKSINANASKGCNVEHVLKILDEMDDDMDEVLLSSMVEACIRCGRADLLVDKLQRQRASKRIQIKGPHTYGSIIRAYGFVQDIANVWDTWREMRSRHILPTSVTLGCMVEALVTNGDVEGGYQLICDMNKDAECAPLVNAIIYCSVLKGFSHQKRFDRVWSVYQEMLTMKVQFSIVTFNTLVDACSRCGEIGRIPGLLKDMVAQGIQINIITYSAILKGYCQGNRIEEAFELVEDMKRTTKLQPDEIMYNTLLDGCARLGLYERGISVLEEMDASGVRPTNFTLSVLVKLAGRSKRLERAFELCEEISGKYKFRLNVHVFSNLIQACISNKESRRAFEVFERMVKERVRPETRTYALLLKASVSAGEGQNAAGLLRAAMGLRGPHPRLASCDPAALRPQGGLPVALLSEILEGIAVQCGDQRLAVALLQDLRAVAHVKFDPKLQFRLTARALSD